MTEGQLYYNEDNYNRRQKITGFENTRTGRMESVCFAGKEMRRMAVGRVGSSDYNYYQNVSQMRLERALEKNPRYQQSLQAVKPVSRVSSYYNNGGLEFIKSYSSTMTDVMSAANSLRSANSGSVANKMAAVSSDAAVAETALKYSSRASKEMTLDVQSVAKAQTNVSDGAKALDQAVSDMDFTVSQKGSSLSVQVSASKADGTTRTNKEMLEEAARQINAGNSGVTAALTEEKGIMTLKLQSKSTGTDHGFTVSGDMGAAAGAEKTVTAAQNAQYSVTEGNVTRNYTSQTNVVSLDTGRISAKLKDTGKTTVSLQADTEKIVKSMSELVDSYNNAVKFLDKNSDRGSGISQQLDRLGANLGSDSTLKRLGISKEMDGTLALDTEKLSKSLKEEPKLTKDLISGSNGIAQNLFHKAAGAMRTSPESLTNYETEESSQFSIYDPYQFMGRYGTTQLNYAMAGMLMNYLV